MAKAKTIYLIPRIEKTPNKPVLIIQSPGERVPFYLALWDGAHQDIELAYYRKHTLPLKNAVQVMALFDRYVTLAGSKDKTFSLRTRLRTL